MSEIDPTMNTNQQEPTKVTTTESGTVYEFPPGTSGIVAIDGSLYNLSPYSSPSDDRIQQPVTLFVPFTITTTRKTPGVYITEVNSDKSPSEITTDTGPTEEAADGPKVEEIDFDTNIGTTSGSGTKQDVAANPPVIPIDESQSQLGVSDQVYVDPNQQQQLNPNEVIVQDVNGVDVTVTIDSDIIRSYINIPPVFFFLIPMYASNGSNGSNGPNTNLIMPKFEDVVQFTASEQIDSSNPWEGGYYTLTHDGFEVITRIDNNFVIKHTFQKDGEVYTNCLKDTPSIDSVFTHEYVGDDSKVYKVLMFPGIVKVTESDSIIFSEIGMKADKIFVESALEYFIGFNKNIVTNSKFDFISDTKEIILSFTTLPSIKLVNINRTSFLEPLFNGNNGSEFKPLSSLMRDMLNDTSADGHGGRVNDHAHEFFIMMVLVGMPIINSAFEFARGSELSVSEFNEWCLWIGYDLSSKKMKEQLSHYALTGYKHDNGISFDKYLLSPFYNDVTDWYTVYMPIGSPKSHLFYKFAKGEFAFNERIVLKDSDHNYNNAEIIRNANISVTDVNQLNSFECTNLQDDRSDQNDAGWIIKSAKPFTKDTFVRVILQSSNGNLNVSHELIFFVNVKDAE